MFLLTILWAALKKVGGPLYNAFSLSMCALLVFESHIHVVYFGSRTYRTTGKIRVVIFRNNLLALVNEEKNKRRKGNYISCHPFYLRLYEYCLFGDNRYLVTILIYVFLIVYRSLSEIGMVFITTGDYFKQV